MLLMLFSSETPLQVEMKTVIVDEEKTAGDRLPREEDPKR